MRNQNNDVSVLVGNECEWSGISCNKGGDSNGMESVEVGKGG